MADAVIRYQIADYLNTGSGSSETWSLMGIGFNTLDESPNAQSSSKTYISQKAQSSTIRSYQPQFPFDTDLIPDEDAIMALYRVGRNQLTGSEAEMDYVRVELFETASGSAATAYPARKFKVSVQVSNIQGNGGEEVKVTGNLNVVGDYIDGTFDVKTKTFTATA